MFKDINKNILLDYDNGVIVFDKARFREIIRNYHVIVTYKFSTKTIRVLDVANWKVLKFKNYLDNCDMYYERAVDVVDGYLVTKCRPDNVISDATDIEFFKLVETDERVEDYGVVRYEQV
jgi:hypothetical protein